MIFGRPKPPLLRQNPQNLSEWLDIATGELVPAAQARVRPEIEAHFTEAVQSHLDRGLPEPAARSAVLADLGDANIAAQRFRREHLTIPEAKAMEWRIKNARGTGLAFNMGLVCVTCAILVSFLTIVAWAFEPAMGGSYLFFAAVLLTFVLIYAFVSIVADVQARRKPTLATVRQTILLGTIKMLILNILTLTVMTSILMRSGREPLGDLSYVDLMLKVGGGMSIVGTLISMVTMSRVNYRLRKKLTSAREDDLAPRDPAT